MSTLISIVGEINYKRVREFVEQVQSASTDGHVEVSVCSHGGDESCGRAIAGMIKHMRSNGVIIDTSAYGDVHSAAIIIFAAGEQRFASHAANFMLHESSIEAGDRNASGFKKLSKQMEVDEAFWCKLLEQYTSTEAKVWAKLHEAETFLSPDEALKLNLATKII